MSDVRAVRDARAMTRVADAVESSEVGRLGILQMKSPDVASGVRDHEGRLETLLRIAALLIGWSFNILICMSL